MASMEDLPILVMKQIFSLLPTSERENCKKVCKRWENIINNDVGVTIFVGNGTDYYYGRKEWSPLSILGRVGIDKCIVGDIELFSKSKEESTSLTIEESLETFVKPDLVQELEFYGKISNSQFHQIMDPLHWLNKLKIHLTIFLSVSFDKIKWRLCNLQRLRIFYTHPVYQLHCPFTNSPNKDSISGKEVVHKNLLNFLKTLFFRRLQEFEFVGPYFIEKTEDFIDTVRAFVEKHERTLNSLTLSFPYEWSNEKKGESFGTAESKRNTIHNGKQFSRERRNYWGNVQLKRLYISCPTTVVPPIFQDDPEETNVDPRQTSRKVSCWSQKTLNTLWKSLLQKQHHLKNVQYLNKYEDWPFPQAIFLNNAQHLKTISLCVNSHFLVDCELLQSCVNLRRLILEGNDFFLNEDVNGGDEDDLQGIKQITNLHLLPPSIQEIAFTKLLIPCSELEVFLEGGFNTGPFPSLRLYQVSKGLPRFGVSTRAVRSLLMRQHITFAFWQALNQPSFQNAANKLLNKVIDRNLPYAETKENEEEDDDDVMTLKEMLLLSDPDEEISFPDNLRFGNLNDLLVKRIIKRGAAQPRSIRIQ